MSEVQVGIDLGVDLGLGLGGYAKLSITKKFDDSKLPKILTIHEAANAAVSLSKNNPLPLTYDEAIRGLLSATLEGFFSGSLLHEEQQQVEVEGHLTELAKLAKNNDLPEPQRGELLCKIRNIYTEHKENDDLSTVSDDKLLEIFSNKEELWLGLGTTGRANGEFRSIKNVSIEESIFIGLLCYYVSQFQKLIDKDNLPKTFAELNAKYPNEMKQFKKILLSHFKLPSNFPLAYDNHPFFMNEFKKMKISKKLFNSWYKQYLNKNFN